MGTYKHMHLCTYLVSGASEACAESVSNVFSGERPNLNLHI
jgi:hypothetical protein